MKKTLCLVLIICAMLFSACRRVTENSADEFTSKAWLCDNPSGVSGKLTFEGDTALLIISLEEGEYEVKGRFAIDSRVLYITDEKLMKTYEFPYEVYADRVYISYEENTLEFAASDD